MLSLAEAAAYLGYSVHGLRKIIRRQEIEFVQRRKGCAIRFTQSMLDEFIEKGTRPKVAEVQERKPPKQAKPKLGPTSYSFGFDAPLIVPREAA